MITLEDSEQTNKQKTNLIVFQLPPSGSTKQMSYIFLNKNSRVNTAFFFSALFCITRNRFVPSITVISIQEFGVLISYLFKNEVI